MRENRGSWYLLTGLVLGVIIGVLYAWFVHPVQYTNTYPKTLRADFKDQYRALIATAYLSNGALARARARLDLLGDTDIYAVLAKQAQRTLAEGGSSLEARALGILAVALGQAPPTLPGPTGGPTGGPAPSEAASPAQASPGTQVQTGAVPLTQNAATPGGTATQAFTTSASTSTAASVTQTAPAGSTPTSRAARTAIPTGTSLPTRTGTPTQGAPFVLDQQELVCNPRQTTPLIQVETFDAANQPVAGVEVVVSWEDGENHFYTGVKPDVSSGYADFDMTPGVTYTLRLAEGGQPIPGLTPTECETAGGDRYWGSWRLVFVQP
jgi:hypothetical protein